MATKDMSHSSLEGMMGRMLDTGLFSDIVLVVGVEKHRFNVHKMVLGGRSEVLSAMLQKRWISGDQSQGEEVINLPAHSFAAFQIFLRFLYTDKLTTPKTVDEALEILELSHMYEIAGLPSMVKDLLKEWINAETCLKIYTRSRVIDQDLSEQSFQFFVKIIRSAAEKDQYLEWDAETVKTVLSQEHLDIREVDLFKALLKRANHPYDPADDITVPRSQAMSELMKMIRFPIMGVQRFASEVVPTGVFSNEEVVDMFLHFANPEQTATQYNTTFRAKQKKPSELLVYPNSPTGSLHMRTDSELFTQQVELRPEIRLEVSKSIRLHGIGLFRSEISWPKPGSFNTMEFQVTIKNEEGILVANKEGMGFQPNITFDEPPVLRQGKAYVFNVTYKLNSVREPLSEVNVYCHGPVDDGITANSRTSVNLDNGVIGTITYNPENGSHEGNYSSDRSGSHKFNNSSKWIRQLLYSINDPQEFASPCNIT